MGGLRVHLVDLQGFLTAVLDPERAVKHLPGLDLPEGIGAVVKHWPWPAVSLILRQAREILFSVGVDSQLALSFSKLGIRLTDKSFRPGGRLFLPSFRRDRRLVHTSVHNRRGVIVVLPPMIPVSRDRVGQARGGTRRNRIRRQPHGQSFAHIRELDVQRLAPKVGNKHIPAFLLSLGQVPSLDVHLLEGKVAEADRIEFLKRELLVMADSP